MLKTDRLTLDGMRAFGTGLLVSLIALALVATVIAGVMVSSPYLWVATLIAAGALALPAWNLHHRRNDASARLTLGLAAPLGPAALLCVTTGHHWQVDMHMAFFAILATLVILCDWRPILAGTAVTAVHHLLVTLIAPQFVFGVDAGISRVLLHAVLVLIEASVLMWTANALVVLLDHSERALRQSEEATHHIRAQQEIREAVLGSVQQGLDQLASGDLTIRIHDDFPAEYEPLRVNFNRSAASIESAISSLVRSIDRINGAIRELNVGAHELADRTEKQASSIGGTCEAAAATNEVARSVATRAGESEHLFRVAFADAEQSQEVVTQAKLAMQAINRSSSEITAIIGMIEGIAFQTTLLALNAGVEAARSGEAGRGFAVVATEVRALAEKCAEAAADIRDIVARNSNQIHDGVELVEKTGSTLNALVDRFGDLRALIDEIAESTRHQSSSIGLVTDGIADFEQTTQSNAAMVEESNAATHALAEEMQRISDLAARFRCAA